MKLRIIAASCVFSAGFAGQAVGQTCTTGTNAVTGAALVTLVAGQTMCARRAPDRWQEFHQGATAAGGALIDYKRGPTDAVDRTETVGTWLINNDRLTHTYSGTNYSWLVCRPGNSPNLTLVSTGSSGTISGVTMLPGQSSACP